MRFELSREQACLKSLCSGEDAWSEFWALFGHIIAAEVGSFDGKLESLVDDVFQVLVLKLMAGRFQILRRHLSQSPQRSFGALLRKIVRNLLIDELRRMRRRGETDLYGGELRALGNLLPATRNRPKPVEARDTVITLFEAVAGSDRNSPGFQILYLRFLEGESVISIAEATGLKPNAVSQRIRYYLQKIRASHLDVIRELDNE